MEEAVTFWLDNKISSGIKLAEIGSQSLVLYREKYYLVERGAARMRGVRPLHFSKTTLPTIWKKAMLGILPPASVAIIHPEDENLPVTIPTKKERTKMLKENISETARSEEMPSAAPLRPTAPKKAALSRPAADAKPARILQETVAAACPYCSTRHELPFEKGKNGKPFFVACSKCSSEFAVRYVPVTLYQAQVAAFR
ncbi:MAG TPA: hypothetical protein HPP94_05810 [Desulfuromonadales bacterium]|nr:hypothetical protein [Desulfuromonadales bacterium]